MGKFISSLRNYGGVPTIFVNDRPVHGLFRYGTTAAALNDIPIGLHMVHVGNRYVNAVGADCGFAVARIDQALAREPEAFIGVRTFPSAPEGWLEAHPNEAQQFEAGAPGLGLYPSFGSLCWREKVCAVYEQFARELHQHYEGRVILYQFGAGSQGEWNPFGAPDNYGRWYAEDFSPAMQAYFRAWLAAHYGTLDALRGAWSDSMATFATAMVPTREERLQTDWLTFRDPRRHKVADFYAAYCQAISEHIIDMCAALKRGTDGEALAGSHAGAFLDNGLHAILYNQVTANTLRTVVRAKEVDTFTSPISYLGRKPGGSPTSMVPTGSLRLHGKYRLQDQDTRTFIARVNVAGNDIFNLFGVPRTLEESLAVLKRDVGRAMLGGHGVWWHDLPRGNYEHPEIAACVRRLVEIAGTALHLERGYLPEVAVMADERSPLSQECANRLLYPLLYAQRVEDFSHAGVSWEIFEAADFLEPGFPSSKLILMLNLFELDEREITDIRARLAGSGATVVWFVAPGVQSPRGFDLDAITRLSGFRVGAFPAALNPRVSITDYTHPITRELAEVHSFGTGSLGMDERESIFGPIFYVDDAEATVLGVSDALYRPGFAVKEMDGWRSVYCSAPRLSRGLLRGLAKWAGVHSWLESEAMLAVTPELLLIHSADAGEHRLRFPTPRDVADLWTGEVMGRQVEELAIKLDGPDTRLLFHGQLERLKE